MNTKYLILTVLLLVNTLYSSAQKETASINLVLPGHDHTHEVTVEVKDGFLIYEGDIIVGEADKINQKAATLLSSGRLWPNGTIPYQITEDHPSASSIRDAIEHVNTHTNLCLIERSIENDYVEFRNSNSCASSIGKVGGRQIIMASQYCGFGSYVHEILHAAGVYHEQSRHDRDDHIHIHWDEINDNYEHNFRKYHSGQDVGNYDYESIMHYHAYAFSSTGNKTITVVDSAPEGTRIGQRNALSDGDIVGINNLYPTPSNCGNSNLQCEDSGEIIDLPDVIQWDGMTIVNSGSNPTPPVMVDLYFSRNSSITPSDHYLGSVQIPAIEQGQRHTFGQELDKESFEYLVDDRPYHLGFIIDSNDEVDETDEGDNNDCANASTDFTSPALPVELIAFTAEQSAHGGTELQWKVSEQYELLHYVVQSSTDGQHWTTLETIKATNRTQQEYYLTDRKKYRTATAVYYRLQMVDLDGTTYLSENRIVHVKEQQFAELTVFPNPSNGQFQINLPRLLDSEYIIKIVSLNGQVLHEQTANDNTLQINLQHLSAGTYWMNIISATDAMTQKLVLTE